ncbi:MAG: hypothetical protein ACYC0H_07755 [Solirubrobacteraceae bacterium]
MIHRIEGVARCLEVASQSLRQDRFAEQPEDQVLCADLAVTAAPCFLASVDVRTPGVRGAGWS